MCIKKQSIINRWRSYFERKVSYGLEHLKQPERIIQTELTLIINSRMDKLLNCKPTKSENHKIKLASVYAEAQK